MKEASSGVFTLAHEGKVKGPAVCRRTRPASCSPFAILAVSLAIGIADTFCVDIIYTFSERRGSAFPFSLILKCENSDKKKKNIYPKIIFTSLARRCRDYSSLKMPLTLQLKISFTYIILLCICTHGLFNL